MYNDIGHTSEKTMPLTEREIWRREERRKDIESLRRFRPIDDIFMRIIVSGGIRIEVIGTGYAAQMTGYVACQCTPVFATVVTITMQNAG
jgi:hypothetical protein